MPLYTTVNSSHHFWRFLGVTSWPCDELTVSPDLYLKTVTVAINCSYVSFAPVYIDITADTNHLSIPNLHIAHLITSLSTLSKLFPNPWSQNRHNDYQHIFTLVIDTSYLSVCLCYWLQRMAMKYIRELRSKKRIDGPLACRICRNKSFTATATLLYHYRSHAG